MQYVLREQSIGKNISRIGLVAGAHAIFVAALIATLNNVEITSAPPPPTPFVPVKPIATPPDPPKLMKPHHAPSLPHATVPLPVVAIDPPITHETITATPTTVTTPTEIRDPSPPVVADNGSAAPSAAQLGVACPNAAQVQGNMRYPAQALREGIEGDVTARFVVTAAGAITNVTIAGSSSRVFNNVVTQAVQQFGCVGQGYDVVVEAPFTFRLK
jgi:periplasmic protein TonB